MSETQGKTKLPPPPAADALHQVELTTGSEETAIRVRCVGPKGAQEREGSLSELHPWIAERNRSGDNAYMVAQVTGQIPEGACTKNADVIEIRCLYADGDESELPESWHVPPTFTLVHPKTNRWWAFWTVQLVSLDKLSELVRRIAAQYRSDTSICNPARIVRLAGYDRWKYGKNYGPYELHRLSGVSTEPWMHEGLDPLPKRATYIGPRDAESVIELNRLRRLLLLVPPGKRKDWLNVMLMMRDGTVIDEKLEVLDDADKLALFDSWASGELYSQMTGVSL